MKKRKAKASEVAGIEDLERRLRTAKNRGDYKEVANLYNQLGNQHRHLGNYEEALHCHEEEINTCKVKLPKERLGLGIGYRNMGEVLLEMKNEAKAILNIRHYLNISKQLENFVEEQRAYITLGRAYLSLAEKESSETDGAEQSRSAVLPETALDKAKSCFRHAYTLLNEDQLRDQLNDQRELMLMKCSTCQNLGLTLEMQGKFAEASDWLKKAVEIGEKNRFFENLAPCFTVLCGICLKTGKPREALDAAKQASKAAKSVGNLALEVESQLLEAKALFQNDEIDIGIKVLKRLRKKVQFKEDLQVYLEELDPLLTTALKIARSQQDILYDSDKSDVSALVRLHEKLGDYYTALLNHEVAVDHYRKCCELAQASDMDKKKLAKLYFSVAESYRDLRNYSCAYDYYQEEIELHNGNPEEQFKTQTNITAVLEKLNKPNDEVIEAHELAIDFAKLTKKPIKQTTALMNFGLYLKTIGKLEESKRQIALADKIKTENNVDDDESEVDSQDLLADNDSDIDLDQLSDEDTDDEVDEGKNVAKGSSKGFTIVRNELGESKLHRAAKKGDLKAVTRLIRQGHPVNVKDHAGWTPLHEACNFGYAEVVELLLLNGAEVNDVGGVVSEKTTPLHDAASNCHCDVMKILLKYKANVLARDGEGRYPIDILLSWRQSEPGREASEQDLVRCREILDLLKSYMAKAGRPFRKEDSKKARLIAKTRSRSPKTSLQLLVNKPQDFDCPIPVKIVTDDFDPDQEGEGRKLYASAMQKVRRTDKGTSKPRPRAMSPGPRNALIPDELDVSENWLLPDGVIGKNDPCLQAGLSKPKRKRDPVDDPHCQSRSTRQKTGGHSKNRSNTGRKSTSAVDRVVDMTDESSNSTIGGDDIELLDDEVDSSRVVGNPLKTLSRAESESLLSSKDSDDLNSEFDDDLNDTLLNIPMDDDFLPSQTPLGPVEFGKTRDVPVFENNDENGERENSLSPPRRRKSSPTRGHRTLRVSSSDDDDVEEIGSSSCRRSMSEISNAAKRSIAQPQSRIRKISENKVQSRLPYKPVDKSSRKSDGTNAAQHKRNEIRRTLSSSSLTMVQMQETAPKRKVMLLKIQIGDKSLRVPIEDEHQDKTVEWLANECAVRYQTGYGVKPNLLLQTKDGASLSGGDPISLVLDESERELVGVVTGFDLPPLVERYVSTCKDGGVDPNQEIKAGLNQCQSSNILHLCDVNLRGKAGQLLMTALQRQSSLNVLVLSGCSLFDNGLIELCKALPTLHGVTELDLSGNGLTKVGLLRLMETYINQRIPSGEPSIGYVATTPVLHTLILSHNPFGNTVGTYLASLITNMITLKRLELADCDFTEKLFTWSKGDFTKALNNSRLETLDISHNNWKGVGVDRIVQCLPARLLQTLNCSSAGCFNDQNDEALAKALSVMFLNEDCCNLTTLKLNDCHFTDKSIDLIIEGLGRLVRLQTVELACNVKLTSSSLSNLLQYSAENNVPITKLDMGCISNFWDGSNEDVIIRTLERKMSSNTKLRHLRLPSMIDTDNPTNEELNQLSKLETRMVELMEDFAGNATFHFDKQDSCILFCFDD